MMILTFNTDYWYSERQIPFQRAKTIQPLVLLEIYSKIIAYIMRSPFGMLTLGITRFGR